MNMRSALRRPRTWVIGVPIVVLLAVVGGPFVYINFVKDDAPDRLSLDDTTATTGEPSSGDDEASAGTAADASIDGSYAVIDGSTEAVGRTSAVTGQLLITGTTLDSATFEVDLTSVSSDDDRRDNQFRTRIMDTSSFPTATFVLTEPVDLTSVPADLEEVTVSATGELTLRGVTNEVTFDLTARRNGEAIEVNGTIPITFADYEIPDASFGRHR
jgi:polyisoprenoid-binding protein YceI